jgi:hypothetical protein
MLNRPPRHRADAVPVYIDSGDPAWDMDRVAKERADMEKAKRNPDRHPVPMYFSGFSRYDLEATFDVLGEQRCAKDYVDMAQAWCFNLKRLGSRDWYSIKSRVQADPDGAFWRACQMGLESIDGPDAPRVTRGPAGVSEDCMDRLFLEIEGGPFLIPRVGQAVYLCSMPLWDFEGKP